MGVVSCVVGRRNGAEHEKNTNKGVISCSVHVVGERKTPNTKQHHKLVLFRVRRVWKAFVNKDDEEETLLVIITVNQINKN